jgi:hypothetical protein
MYMGREMDRQAAPLMLDKTERAAVANLLGIAAPPQLIYGNAALPGEDEIATNALAPPRHYIFIQSRHVISRLHKK